MYKSILLFLSAISIASAADLVKPPPSACSPRQELINYIKEQPDGRAFCTSLNIKPRLTTTWVYNGTATVTAPVQSDVIVTEPVALSTYFTVTTKTVTVPGVSITSNYNVTKHTVRTATKTTATTVINVTATTVTTVTETFTPGVTVSMPPSSSGTGTGTSPNTFSTGTAKSTYSTGTGTGGSGYPTSYPTVTRAAVPDWLGDAQADSNMVVTIKDPVRFPVPSQFFKRHLKNIRRKELKKRATSPVIVPTSWPFYKIVNEIPNDAFETACDCIVGVPTSTQTTVATGTNYITYINTASTRIGTVTYPKSAPPSTVASATFTATAIPTVVITMTRTVQSWSTSRTFVTTTYASTKTVASTVTTTVFPACATGYAENGYVGTGNRVELIQVPGPDAAKSCCERCQKTNDCVANVYVGFMCQLLINEEAQAGEKKVGYCPKGIEAGFMFASPSGKVRKGPCAA